MKVLPGDATHVKSREHLWMKGTFDTFNCLHSHLDCVFLCDEQQPSALGIQSELFSR